MGAYAQGTVNFSSFVSGTLQVAVYAPQVASPTVETTGNSATDTPPGSTAYTGGTIGGASTGSGSTGYANGANFTAQLYALGGGTTLQPFSALQPVSQYVATFFTVPAGAGYFREAALATDNGIPNSSGGSASIAVAAWYNGVNTINSLGAAQSAKVPYGWSTPFVLSGLGGTGSPPATTPNLIGLTSFSLVTPSSVPEPGVISLCIMGAGALLMRRRK